MHTNIREEVENLDKGENIIVHQEARGIVNCNWVLMNNQSTVNQIKNPGLLANIRKAKNPITVHCRLVLILAGAICNIWDFFWYIPTSA
jgi:hypothetical protein